MKIAIIGAMKIETDSLISALQNTSKQNLCGVNYVKGTLNGHTVCVCKCGVGKVNAAICTQTLIIAESPDEVLNIGVAGGSPCMNIGDVAIATSFVQHDANTTAIGDPPGFIDVINTAQIKADEKICDRLDKAALSQGIDTFKGMFATGDEFVVEQKINSIKEAFKDARVFEMESGAIAHVCENAGVASGAIKVISDNGKGAADYNTFKFEAAEKCFKVINAYLNLNH